MKSTRCRAIHNKRPGRRPVSAAAPPANLVYGRIPAFECLKAGKRAVNKVHLLQGGQGLESIARAAQGIPIVYHDRGTLDKLGRGGVHQGVVLEVDALPVLDFEDWLDALPEGPAVVAVLDGVEDPHNLGAIVRSAAATGAVAVVSARDRAAPLSPAAVKSAAGAMEHIDLVQANNLVRAVEQLKDAGFTVAALDARGDALLWEADLTGRTGIVIGSEGKGIRRLVLAACDATLRIPLMGPITSLNASVSAAIAFAECLRQRSGPQ